MKTILYGIAVEDIKLGDVIQICEKTGGFKPVRNNKEIQIKKTEDLCSSCEDILTQEEIECGRDICFTCYLDQQD